jgi:hypothetical protein
LAVRQARGRIAVEDGELRGVDAQKILVVDVGVDRPERGIAAVYDRELLRSHCDEADRFIGADGQQLDDGFIPRRRLAAAETRQRHRVAEAEATDGEAFVGSAVRRGDGDSRLRKRGGQ